MKTTGISVDRASGTPLHRQLASSFREAIRSGRLAPRERILSSRELQTHLGLSRNTIVEALEQLHAEGYLVTVRGVGTFVADLTPHRPARTARPQQTGGAAISATAAQALTAKALAENTNRTRPFRPGIPALDLFPSAQFKRCFKSEDWSSEFLEYPDPQGYEPLREAIAVRLRQTRGIECEPDRIFITGGAQPAFDLIARVLLERGDVAVMEDPGYSNVRATLQLQGARILPAPVDEHGIRVDTFAKRRARLAYVTPSHQYPSGAVLSLERRLALLQWAERSSAWIVEDDYDSEFNYTGRPQPALYSLSESGRVLYTGTFSKVLAPALRLAYVVVPAALCAPMRAAQIVFGGAPQTVTQAALARFMNDGHFGRHIAKMRKVYDERRHLVSEELARCGLFEVHDSRAGLHFVAELPENIRDSALSAAAAAAGLVVPALSMYYQSTPARNALIIGYAAIPPNEARKAVRALERLTASVT